MAERARSRRTHVAATFQRAVLGALLCAADRQALAQAPQSAQPTSQAQNGTPASETPGRRERVYSAQLAMSLETARRIVLWVEAYGGDNDLARYSYPVADKLVEVTSHLTPPAKWLPAHPHVLLIVEHVERALDAAAASDLAGFRHHTRVVREELAILEGVFKQLKLKLPEFGR